MQEMAFIVEHETQKKGNLSWGPEAISSEIFKLHLYTSKLWGIYPNKHVLVTHR